MYAPLHCVTGNVVGRSSPLSTRDRSSHLSMTDQISHDLQPLDEIRIADIHISLFLVQKSGVGATQCGIWSRLGICEAWLDQTDGWSVCCTKHFVASLSSDLNTVRSFAQIAAANNMATGFVSH